MIEAIRVLASSAFCAYKILPLEASIAIADFAATVKLFVVVVSALTAKPERTDKPVSYTHLRAHET